MRSCALTDNGEMQMLELKNIWNGPGYRDLLLVFVDSTTKRETEVRVQAKDMQRLINACADAVKQIGTHPPLDWERHPTTIYWPSVTPWKAGEAKRNTECHCATPHHLPVWHCPVHGDVAVDAG